MRTRYLLVPFVLCMEGVGALCLSGCGDGDVVEEVKSSETALPTNSPAVYMKDPVFRQQLEEKRKELLAIVKERKPLADRMQALVKEHGQDLAALQKIDEWNDLHKKVTALNAKYEEVRKRQLVIAAKRINPSAEKKVSK